MLPNIIRLNDKIRAAINIIEEVREELKRESGSDSNQKKVEQIIIKHVNDSSTNLLVTSDILFEIENCQNTLELESFINEFSGGAA